MTRLVLLGALILAAPIAWADEPTALDCDAQVELVMGVVNGRVEGVRKAKARRVLRDGLDRNAADMLADWVYELPPEQLTDEIGAAWKVQCEAL